MNLKETGNQLFKAGNVSEAVIHYDKAIGLVELTGGNAGLTNRELAVLYGNRAEAFLKLKSFNKALDDARECVGYDGHWYKVPIFILTVIRHSFQGCHGQGKISGK